MKPDEKPAVLQADSIPGWDWTSAFKSKHNEDMALNEKALRLLQKYADRVLSRGEVAQMLGVTERQVNRYMKDHGFERQPSPSALDRELAAKHRLARQTAAEMVLEGKLTITDAARRAGCSERTIYRYLKR
jgi:AraC-like DNA-binding protein